MYAVVMGAAGGGVSAGVIGGTRIAADGSLAGQLWELVSARGHTTWLRVDASYNARDGVLRVLGAPRGPAFGSPHHWVGAPPPPRSHPHARSRSAVRAGRYHARRGRWRAPPT